MNRLGPPSRKTLYEGRNQPLISRLQFLNRLLRHLAFACAIVLPFLLLGMMGYKWLVGVPTWVDAFLNASMILGGMGPIAPILPTAAKIFAGLYALASGLVFVVVIGVVLAPVVHRILHRFNLPAAP